MGTSRHFINTNLFDPMTLQSVGIFIIHLEDKEIEPQKDYIISQSSALY